LSGKAEAECNAGAGTDTDIYMDGVREAEPAVAGTHRYPE
jgi:hypothetical protein